MTLKELNFPFMPLGRVPCGERPQVAHLAGFRIFLSRIQAVLSRLEFPNHDKCKQHVDVRIVSDERMQSCLSKFVPFGATGARRTPSSLFCGTLRGLDQ